MNITEEALTFDDVLLVPDYSEILPRQASLQTQLTREIKMNIPVVSAAMDTVTESELAIALAQVGGILVMNSIENSEKHIPYLAGIENFRFRKIVLPGDTLILKSSLLSPIKRGIAKMKAEAFVGDELVSEGIMTATIVKNK